MSEENITPDASEPQQEEAAETEVSEAPQPRKYKVKVDQEEMEVDEEELLKGYQLSKASNKRFQEASTLQKQVERLIEDSRKDPRKMFEVLGLNPREWSEQLLLQELEESLLTPADKQRRQEQQELEEYRQQKLTAKQKQEEAEKASYFEKASQEIDDEISQVLIESNLKPTARNIARMAEYMLASMGEDGSRLSAKDAFGKVRNDYSQDIQDLLQTTPIEKLIELLPKNFINELRRHELSKVTQAQLPSFSKPGSKPQATASEEKPRRKSIDELLK